MIKKLSTTLFSLMLLVAFAGVLMTTGCNQDQGRLGPKLMSQEAATSSERKQALDLYHEAWQVVFTEYADSNFNGQNWYRWKDRYNAQIQTREDAYVAIRTMLTSLNDVYTRFLDPRKAQDQNMHIDSRLSGVGIQIASKDNALVVIAPLEDSPAEKAGIKSLDKIIEINGEPTANMTIDDAVDKIRGPQGTPVALTIMRSEKRLSFKLTRAEIVIKTVFGAPVDKDIGYIRLASFISQDTPQEMMQKLATQKNTKALILDVRGNNGGLLPNALQISDMFLTKGKIVSIVDRKGQSHSFYADRAQLYDKPVVLLIDQGSASASEILGGALKDNGRATLVGATTFGKGLVQKISYLQDGSEMNLTISKYYTPKGSDIDKKGIAPDHSVTLSEKDFVKNKDPQKDFAVSYLKKHHLAKAS